MKTRKVIWNLARCVLTLALVFAFTTAVVGCAEQNKSVQGDSKTCPKDGQKSCCEKQGDKTCPMAKDAKTTGSTPAAPAAKPVEKAPTTPAPVAPAKPAEKPAGHP